MLISEAFSLYRSDYIVMMNQSKKTEESYASTCKLLVRFFGDVSISDMTFEDVREFRAHIATWQSPDTVRGYVVCLRSVLKFLRKRKFTVLDYEEIPVARREKRMITYLTEFEVEEFIAEVAKPRRGYNKVNRIRNIAIVKTLYATGLRNSELCALNRNSIKNRTFTVVGKSKEPRICFINQEAEDAIKEYLALRTDRDPALFVSEQTSKRIRPETIRRVFQFTCERSRFNNIHPHTIRHSYATKLLEKKVDLRYIGDLMGHVSLDTTKVYTHYSNPRLKEVYDNAHANVLTNT